MELFFEFIVFLGRCALWYFAITLLIAQLRQIWDQKIERLQETIDKLEEMVHVVNVEQHGEYFYWFDVDNDEFLAQGKTADETISHLKSRFPNHIFFFQGKDQNYRISAPDWTFIPVDIKITN